MKIDVIDVIKDACETLLGRIIIVVLVINFSGAAGLMMHAESFGDFWECLIFALPALLFTILGGLGLITLPLLLGFTIIYVRFDMHHYYLSVPAILSFFTLYKPYL